MTHAPVEAARSIRNAVERINSGLCPGCFWQQDLLVLKYRLLQKMGKLRIIFSLQIERKRLQY